MQANDLRYKVGRSFTAASDISFRLDGAAYHLDIVREIIEQEIMGKPHNSLSTLSNNKLHWHLAGFFAELISTFDCALQAVVAYRDLPIKRHLVTWNRFTKEIKRAGIDCPLVDKSKEVHSSNWFREAKARRVYMAHWGPAFIQSLIANGRVVAIKAANQMNPVEVWTSYLQNMREMVEVALRTLPKGHILFRDT